MTETQFVAKFDYTKEFLAEQVALANLIDKTDINAVKDTGEEIKMYQLVSTYKK